MQAHLWLTVLTLMLRVIASEVLLDLLKSVLNYVGIVMIVVVLLRVWI